MAQVVPAVAPQRILLQLQVVEATAQRGGQHLGIPGIARSHRLLRGLRPGPFLLAAGLGRRFFWRYLIRDFNPLTLCLLAGLPLLGFGVGFGLYRWWLSIQTGTPATAGTVLLAALPVILGF